MDEFTPSTVPGCRMPHFWLRDGRSLYDAAGRDFALVRLDADIDVSDFADAAAERGIPLRIVDVTIEEAGSPYRQELVLARPDQHIAWRGQRAPANPNALLDLVTGAGSQQQLEDSHG